MRRLVLLLTLAAALHAADEPRWRALNRIARESLQAKDYATLRNTLIELDPLLPGSPRILYNRAAAEARLGNRDAALAELGAWSRMGLVADIAADDSFTALRNTPEFESIVKRVAQNKLPVSHATRAFPIPTRDLIPEDIAYDPATRRFLLSSVRKATIITADSREFARAPWPVFALRVDSARHLLWATTGYVPEGESVDAADKDKTALLAFDLGTGTQKLRIGSPVPGVLGDMTISRRGDLYISESLHGAVLRLKAGAATLERLDEAGEFPSPQTSTLSADEKILYIPDYIRGIAAMHLDTRRVEWLRPGTGIALNGIDGLYLHRGSFVAVQNGTAPPRIIRFSRDLQHQEILEANTPGLGEPTHGTFLGDDFYFIANAGWNQYDQNGKKKDGADPVISEVRRIHLAK